MFCFSELSVPGTLSKINKHYETYETYKHLPSTRGGPEISSR